MSQPSQTPALPADVVPISIRLGSVLAWLGSLISLVLVSHEGGLTSFLCPARGGCETVLSSPFASIRGVPLPVFGAIFFLTQLALWLATYAMPAQKTRLRLLDAALWLAVAGATFSAGLMGVQFGVLRAFCPLCTASALTTVALLVVAIKARRRIASEEAGASPAGAGTLAVFALLPVAIFLASLASGGVPSRGQLIELSPGHRSGPAAAAVQIHVFTDFQCSYCGQLSPILQRLAAENPRDLAITYRHFPLEGHPRAFDAAVAAECAAEQNAFHPYAAKLYSEGGKLVEEDFIALAVAIGLDRARFAACLRSEAPRQAVEANARDALRLEIEGLPAVYLNGRRIRTGLDYETLSRQVRNALPKSPAGK